KINSVNVPLTTVSRKMIIFNMGGNAGIITLVPILLGREFLCFYKSFLGGKNMLDMKYLRNNYEFVKEKLKSRGEDLSALKNFGALDERRRQLISETEQLKAQRNEVSKQIAILKKDEQDATDVIKEMRTVGEQIKQQDHELTEIEEKLNAIMYSIPNIPHESVPIGEDEEDNVEIRTWGEQPVFDFEIQPD